MTNLRRALLLAVALASALASAESIEGLRNGMPVDWSHRHVMIRNPDTAQQASAKGTVAFDKWNTRMRDPRFAAAVARKSARERTTAGRPFTREQLKWAARFERPAPGKHPHPRPGPPIPAAHQDWSSMLGKAAVGKENVFPAKYTWDVNATPSCTNDFIVFPAGAAPSASSGTATVYTLTLTSNAAAGNTVTLTRANAPTLTLTASATANTGYNFLVGASAAASAQNITDAINRNGSQVGVSASRALTVVTITSKVTNASSFAAATSIASATATKSTTGTNGNGQATIVALNQLYALCSDGTAGHPVGQTVPNVYWAFNTGGTSNLSPALSYNGDQVAFVQVVSGTASLVFLKWSGTSGTIGAPTTLTAQTSAANYRSCTAPCMYSISLGANDTFSSPYVDYEHDVVYVGDDAGKLHKFTGAFLGNPAEYTSDGFQVTVASGAKLTSPVYDSTSQKVFLASDMSNTTTGGKLYSVVSKPGTTATVVATQQLGATTIAADTSLTPTGIRDAVIVDSVAGTVYVFIETTSLSWASCGTGIECKTVMQFGTGFTSGSTPTITRLGRGQIPVRQLNAGSFDQAFLESSDGTGNLYICGSNGLLASSNLPTLWQIPISAGIMNTTANQGPVFVTANSGDCSPVTQLENGGSEFLFVSVPQNLGNTGNNYYNNGCDGTSGSCSVYMVDLNNLQHSDSSTGWGPAIVPNASLVANGGTTGIVVDNISTGTGASQIYFLTLTTTANPLGAAVQASQAALQ